MKVFGQVWTGFRAPIDGILYLKSRPILIVLAIIPFVAFSISVLYGFTWSIKHPEFIEAAANYTGLMNVNGWSGWVLKLLVRSAIWLASFFFVLLASYCTVQIITGPFSSLLSERTLVQMGVLEDKKFEFSRWISHSLKMLRISLLKALVFLGIGVILFVLSLIPIVSIFAAVGFWMLMAFDCADFSFENLGYSFRDRVSFFSRNFFLFLGFALSIGIILIIPLANFFLFPASVVGAGIIISKTKKAANGF